MGCAGPKAAVDQQLKSALKAGFSPDQAVKIVAISQAESCGGQVYSTGPDNGPGIGVPFGNLQFIPANQNLGGCNLNDPDPQKALDCNFKTAYALYKQQGFCAWASYSDSSCAGQSGRVNTYSQFLAPTQNVFKNMQYQGVIGTFQGLTTGQQNPVGQAIVNSPPGQALQAAGGTVTHALENLGTGFDALTKPFQAIAGFFSSPKAAFARIVLFILGIFIAFEAVKHLGGSNQNIAVVGVQNAGSGIKSSFAKKGEEAAEVA